MTTDIRATISRLLDGDMTLDAFILVVTEAAIDLDDQDVTTPQAMMLLRVSRMLDEFMVGRRTRFELHDELATMLLSG